MRFQSVFWYRGYRRPGYPRKTCYHRAEVPDGFRRQRLPWEGHKLGVLADWRGDFTAQRLGIGGLDLIGG